MGDGGTVVVLSRGERHQVVLPPLGGHCRGAFTTPPLLLAARCQGPPVGGPETARPSPSTHEIGSRCRLGRRAAAATAQRPRAPRRSAVAAAQ